VEDFGIVPVEAQACGCPVVALGHGGACETVIDGTTGLLVTEPTAEAFAAALTRALQTSFDPGTIRRNALRFSRAQFLATFTAAVADAIAEKHGRHDGGTGAPASPETGPGDAAHASSPTPQAAPRRDAAIGPPKSQEAPREND
jgi:hypothetical protein